jgi:hypothetical protein
VLGGIERREQVQPLKIGKTQMKRHLSMFVAACLGLCAGFALCCLCLVLPHHEGKATPSTPQQEKTIVTVTRDGSLYLAGELLDLGQLTARFKELGARQPITIRADRSTDYKRVLEVIDACKAAALSRISITTVTAR